MFDKNDVNYFMEPIVLYKAIRYSDIVVSWPMKLCIETSCDEWSKFVTLYLIPSEIYSIVQVMSEALRSHRRPIYTAIH